MSDVKENIHIDTKSFDETITNFRKYIGDFREILESVKSIINTMDDKWKGEGAKAFQYDCSMVQSNLNDIRDIMEEMCDSLVQAEKEYIKNDEEVSKAWQS